MIYFLVLNNIAIRASMFRGEIYFTDWQSAMDKASYKSLLCISSVMNTFIMTMSVDRLECLEVPCILLH